MSQLKPRPLEGPASEIGSEGFGEAIRRRFGPLGEDRPGMPQAEGDPHSRILSRLGFDLRHTGTPLLEPVKVEGRLGQVRDEPAGHYRVVGRVVDIEQPLCALEGVSVSRGPKGRLNPAELRQSQHEVRPPREARPLGFRRRSFGQLLVTAHPGDQRTDGRGAGRPQWLFELVGKPARFVRRGDRNVPIREACCHRAPQGE